MAVAIGDVVRLTAKMKLFGTEDIQNVFHYKVTRNDTLDDTVFMTEAALLLDIAYTLINVAVADDISYSSVDGQNITQNVLLPETSWPVLTVGINTGNLLPTQAAGCVFWPTTTPKVRTSTFLAGFTDANNQPNGSINPALVALFLLFGNALEDWNTLGVDADKGSQHAVSGVFTPAGQAQVPSRWRTQRRRRVGVGS